ncbi:HEPN domain-containing protein [Sinorhizobium meliloti]|uniref:HEPN domain-containing protein n=1 Tax=Rhizobium meliloti TaxID=382 RepID=UPI000FD827C5|nr:HEPN domain-containing protein [Sinorhizobium meliloti]RVP97115.1 hypothetical protein CN070_23480 [Sinorhizobium meliloti]
MAKSARFMELRRRLADLRRHMLPANFSPTGDYSDRHLDRARGYRLLAHAEIEAFIEDITLGTAKTAVSNWSSSKKPSDVILCLLAHYHGGYDTGAGEVFPVASRPKTKEAIKEIVQVALKQYVALHDQNHGIREDNFNKLVLPIGIRRDELDPTWLTDLDQFGKRRGDVAHKTVKAHQQIDPRAELQDVNKLLVGLELLDSLVQKLRN